ncbi:hypothetical protein Aca07nite_67060 [Actinoplanes capillaceus]|uniref:Secreted protein n=2 Tax=Actinoplanes campanulatus TaxID=113559 RepID=A0ABQ3WT19_9ACTN|nr:hypothetical protein Aca07nite_67060 [Actinoplanes capillaceus]
MGTATIRRMAVLAGLLTSLLIATPASAGSDDEIWYQPGGDQFTPSLIWHFDSGTGSGYSTTYLPSQTAWPVQSQKTFTYEVSESTITLKYPVWGTTGTVELLRYADSSDTLTVKVDGYQQKWYGCQASGLPAAVVAAC